MTAEALASATPAPSAPLVTIPIKPGERRKPVTLQMHRVGGVYFSVCTFDADSEIEEHYVRTAVEILASVDLTLQFRIVRSTFGAVDVLTSYSAANGWSTP